ncbi:MAG: 50S ribosomal protein L11 [Nanoarchaeota archaeon]
MALIKLIIDGGAMKPGPTVAQQLGPMGINIGKVIEDVNKATANFKGIKVPVELNVDAKTKKYEIKVSSPPTAELIKKELGLEKGSGEAGKTKIGNVAIEQIISIAKTKMPNMLARNMKNAVKLVLGSCVSLGVLVENKSPVEVIREVNQGVFDKEIKDEIMTVTATKKAELAAYFNKVKVQQEVRAKAEAEAAAVAEAAKAAAQAAAGTPAAAATAAAAGSPVAAVASTAEAAKAPAKAEAKEEKKKK